MAQRTKALVHAHLQSSFLLQFSVFLVFDSKPTCAIHLLNCGMKSGLTPEQRDLVRANEFSGAENVFFLDEDRWVLLVLKKKVVLYSKESGNALYNYALDGGAPILHSWKDPKNDKSVLCLSSKGVVAISCQVTSVSVSLKGWRVSPFKFPFSDPLMVFKVPEEPCLLFVTPEDRNVRRWNYKTKLDEKNSSKVKVGLSPRGKPLCSAAGDRFSVVVDVDNEERQKKIVFFNGGGERFDWILNEGDSPVTALHSEIHHEKLLIATGHACGKIYIWSKGTKNSYFRAIYHWHSTPVLCLKWDPYSGELYSAGKERVLIQWNIEFKKPKTTVPRLGADVLAVHTHPKYTALVLDNNSIKFYDASNLRKTFAFNGLHVFDHRHGGETRLFRPLDAVVFLSGNHQLQFIDPNRKKELLRLEVASETQITGGRRELNQQDESFNRIIKFDVCDGWLATARQDYTKNNIYVSIWKYCDIKTSFSLSSTLKEPVKIDKDDTFSVHFVNNRNQLALIGSENCVKLWSYEDGAWFWDKTCQFKNMAPSCFASSIDGSVLVVTFGKYVTLWRNTEFKAELITTLSSKEVTSSITSVVMGQGANANILYSTTKDSVFMWNLLNLKLLWKSNKNHENPIVYPIPGKSSVAVKDDKSIKLCDRSLDEKSAHKLLHSSSVTFTSSTINNSNLICYSLDKNVLSEIKWKKHSSNDDSYHNDYIFRENFSNRDSKFAVISDKTSENRTCRKQINPYSSSAFENIQCPLSTFSKSFLDSQVIMYKNTFINNK